MATQTGSIDLKGITSAYSDQQQYFWVESNSSATWGGGAHITNIAESAFKIAAGTWGTDPTAGGYNLLMNTDTISGTGSLQLRNGSLPMMNLDNDSLDFYIMDSTTTPYTTINVATFGSDGARIGDVDNAHSVIDDKGQRFYAVDGTTQLANIGYDVGTATSGTATAPYYTFGVRQITITAYSSSSTYDVGDMCVYDEKMYVCVYDITTPESWHANHWKYYIGNYSIAEGYNTIASGIYSHAEGGYANASGSFSHAEGEEAIANGGSSHAEGFRTIASGASSHAEGVGTIANGTSSHAEGLSTTTSGGSSHAEGYNTIAIGTYSHAQNEGTITSRDAQTSVGTYNVEDTAATTTHPSGTVYYGQHAVIIGNGTDDNTRSNATTIQWDGTARLAGDVYVGCAADSTGGYRLPIVQSGHLGGASVSANSYLDRTVTFDKAFPSAPHVVCSIASTATAGALGSFSVSANSITTTGFTARVFNASSGSRTPGVDWIAVY